MPSLRQIEYLVAIAEMQHFRKAAEHLGISQPTLSAQLRTLEQKLGVQLVERNRSVTLLTPVGKRVVSVGRRVLRDVQEIRNFAQSQRGVLGGTIRLGLPPTIGPYLLPAVLPELHRAHPGLKLHVRESVPAVLPTILAEGGADVILAPLPITSADFETMPLFREPLYVIAPEEHPLATKGYVERRDLRDESILALERGHQLHEQVEAICEEFGARMMFDFEGTSLDTLSQMVAMGMGLSFMPGLYVKTALKRQPGVVALELRGRSLSRTLGVVWRRTSARTEDFEILSRYVQTTVKQSFPRFPLL